MPEPEKTDTSRRSGRSVEFCSGLAAGMSATLVSHPLDFVKLRMQLDSSSKTQYDALRKIGTDLLAASSTPNGSTSTTKLIQNLYRGVGPNLVGSTSAWALYFAFYRDYKNLWLDHKQQSHSDTNLNAAEYMMCAFCAGWSTSILTNPIWVIKTRMIATQRGAPGAYTSIWDGIRQIYRHEGFRGYYKGLTPALFNVSQGAIQMSAYDTFKNHIIPHDGDKRQLTTFEYLYASIASKCISTIVCYPLQVIRTRLQANNANNLESATDLIARIYKGEGLTGFYKGIGANLLRVLPATCITFSVYEKVHQLLS